MSLDWFRKNEAGLKGSLLWNEPLSRHTYYRIGGPCDLMILPENSSDLNWIREGLAHSKAPFEILGAGSNLLVSDEGFRGIIVKLGKLDFGMEASEQTIRTSASMTITTLLRHAGREGWDGFERLAGVPGSVGGVIAMNAGTHLGEAKDLLLSVRLFSITDPTRDGWIDVAASDFEYRRNRILNPGEIITEALWRRIPADPEGVKEKCADVLRRRKSSQPLDFPSCGSVFKNPLEHGRRAWEVIDLLGLRGRRLGNAQFSEKHPNFIVNLGGARAADVAALIQLAKSEALRTLQIPLHEEVKYLGYFEPSR